ncbi:Bgt-4500 [Blumeria graminis f. sp. tritici]|uniref:Bgt-4500 n=2 Tax=Blumeria graminis f. sp. tritici TaxID=62690 RepID=A0A381LCL1_BLUGR|nr:F-box protein component of the SCF ubiquitin-ligase complex [Blumeria graminis f. sp. tritici 96224]VDB89102.1 Bgt-4500 [Blumeria graminis f. sp. tritici]
MSLDSPKSSTKPSRSARIRHAFHRMLSRQTVSQLYRRKDATPDPSQSHGATSCLKLAPRRRAPRQHGASTPANLPIPTNFAHIQADRASMSAQAQAGPNKPVPPVPKSSAPDTMTPPSQLLPPEANDHHSACSVPISLPQPRRSDFDFWGELPHEISLFILEYLSPKELIRASAVSKPFRKLCYDGQLWKSFDASEFYKDISAESLTRILVAAGPFVKDLNLRGCVQVEHYKRAEAVVRACQNLINATLEGCRNFQRSTLHRLIRGNENLANLNLTGLTAVTNETCHIIAQTCLALETLNISWCHRMDAHGIRLVVHGCRKLKDLRAGEIGGFDCLELAQDFFELNRLERLVLSGCTDLTDEALRTIIHGRNPEYDILTNLPLVPIRKLRHLNISRCHRITDASIRMLAHITPNLQGLELGGCSRIGDSGLAPVVETVPNLTHLDVEELYRLTNTFLTENLAKAPCAPQLENLSLSYCDDLGDAGILSIIRACKNLKSIDVDNTKITDLVLTEAAAMVRTRHILEPTEAMCPIIGLKMVVYDCQNITWAGVHEILTRNSEVWKTTSHQSPDVYPEMIGLKCYYGWQMTVDEHTRRLLRGDLPAAVRLECLWRDWVMAHEEIGDTGPGLRRRRRRAREAQILHVDEERAQDAEEQTRRRRSWMGSCAIM